MLVAAVWGLARMPFMCDGVPLGMRARGPCQPYAHMRMRMHMQHTHMRMHMRMRMHMHMHMHMRTHMDMHTSPAIWSQMRGFSRR